MKTLVKILFVVVVAFTLLLVGKEVFYPNTLSYVAPLPERALIATTTPVIQEEVPKLPAIILTPSTVVQGEPTMMTVENAEITDIKSVTFGGQPLNLFLYNDLPTALIGVDIHKKAGKYALKLSLNDGAVATTTLAVSTREVVEEPLSVPEQIGGNSPASQAAVVSELAKENAILATIPTGKKSFWTEKFTYPISGPVITDPYGYARLTGAYTITHKGVDLRAPIDTEVHAMNRGVVRIATEYTVYGKTIVVDHGLGVSTIYMHLSKIYVNPGELVTPGKIIGLSGQTGYAEFPHLHISVKINHISIDPIKFLALFR